MGLGFVEAPFTASQVRKLHDWQTDKEKHPLTCLKHSKVAMEVPQDGGCLRCPECGYEQYWAPSACVGRRW